jgi:hypothetical protein
MDLWELRPGDRIRTANGALAEVLTETEDGRWIKVRYLRSPDEPSLVGTEDLCEEDEIRGKVEADLDNG